MRLLAARLTPPFRLPASCASTQVTLWNTGEDAFQPEVFGEQLTIERTIKLGSSAAAAASSSWKLLNHLGQKVSTTKKRIDDLLDHLNINAGNPLAVMTQVREEVVVVGAKSQRRVSCIAQICSCVLAASTCPDCLLLG